MVNKTASHIEKSTKKVLTNIKNYWLTNPQEGKPMKYAERIKRKKNQLDNKIEKAHRQGTRYAELQKAETIEMFGRVEL